MKIFVPLPKAVIPLFGDVGDVIVPAPEINVHEPVPAAGVFPLSVAVVAAQSIELLPALATVGTGSRFTETVDEELGQIPLLIVHWKTFVPTAIKVKFVLGKVGVTILANPEISVQLPVPTAGVLPARTVDVTQIV